MIARDGFESEYVIGHAGAGEALLGGKSAETIAQAIDARKVEAAVAPLKHAHGFEGVRFEALDEIGVERFGVAGYAEGAVVHVSAGAACDLAHFIGREVAEVAPSNLRNAEKAT